MYTSLKVNENLVNVSLVMLWSSSGQRAALCLKKTGTSQLKHWQDFHPPSSWYLRTVYPTCFISQLRSPTSTIVPLHIYASGKFCMTTFCPQSCKIMHKVYCTKLAMCYILMIMTYPFDVTLVLPHIYVLHANLVYLGHLLLRLQGQDPMHMSV